MSYYGRSGGGGGGGRDDDRRRDDRAIKHIGITNELKHQTILSSSVLLAELFLELTFKDHNDVNVNAGRTS